VTLIFDESPNLIFCASQRGHKSRSKLKELPVVNFGEAHEKEVTVGFRAPEYLIDIVDILCKQEDLNRSQFFRRALDSYEPMRSAIAEFEQETQSIDGISNDS
jgi:hypothetical protein